MDNPDTLEYKNFWLFYSNLYKRLFGLINIIIDENHFNILKVKNQMLDFMDSYSYYLLKKKLVTKDENELLTSDILNLLRSFDKFTENITKYPSKEYTKIQIELKRNNYDINKISNINYKILIKDYYAFFDEILIILKDFIDTSSESGFLPNIKSKSSLKSIGYANYDLFFTQLEELKLKMSEVTTDINLRTLFKSRRCVYCMLVIFSPYFQKKEIYEELITKLNFEFINDDETINYIYKNNSYKNIIDIPLASIEKLDDVIMNDLKINISLIKRYISFEFGERDMSPRIKKKYGYDPTDT